MAAAQREVWTGAQLRRLLAERAGLHLSAASVSALFSKQPAQVKLETLAALCTALECTPNDLIEVNTTPVAQGAGNSSITAVLKNAIDWASRPAANEPPVVAFGGKVASLMSTSPGAFGGLRCLVQLRSILGNIGVIVLPDQIAMPRAFEAFEEDGTLKDAKTQSSVAALGTSLAAFLARFKA